jgi:hypothetical protein
LAAVIAGATAAGGQHFNAPVGVTAGTAVKFKTREVQSPGGDKQSPPSGHSLAKALSWIAHDRFLAFKIPIHVTN